jgi:FtsZ-interacting cell division protein ZipA
MIDWSSIVIGVLMTLAIISIIAIVIDAVWVRNKIKKLEDNQSQLEESLRVEREHSTRQIDNIYSDIDKERVKMTSYVDSRIDKLSSHFREYLMERCKILDEQARRRDAVLTSDKQTQ